MEQINVRYGSSLDFRIEADEIGASSATFYVGRAGEEPSITVEASFVDGVAEVTIPSSATKIPLGQYLYQLTVAYEDGQVEKYPRAEDCMGEEDSGLPKFNVLEALDETEVE